MKLSVKRKNALCNFLKKRTDIFEKEYNKLTKTERPKQDKKAEKIAEIIEKYKDNLGCCTEAVVQLMEEITGKKITIQTSEEHKGVDVPLTSLSCVYYFDDKGIYIIIDESDCYDTDGDLCDVECSSNDIRPATKKEIMEYIEKGNDTHAILSTILLAREI